MPLGLSVQTGSASPLDLAEYPGWLKDFITNMLLHCGNRASFVDHCLKLTMSSDSAKHRSFATTRWSIVVAAGRRSNPNAEAALAGLCECYWMPLYEFARRRGYSSTSAADLTQAFFVCLLEKDYLQSADPERGRFRAFLLTAFKRFLSRERDHDRAQKRGGDLTFVSLNFDHAESLACLEPADDRTPERLFERRWAIVLLDRVLQLLEAEYGERGKSELFTLCRGALTGCGIDDQYASIAATCKMTEAAVKVAIHRMRNRYRELLRAEVAQTVTCESEVEDELRALMEAVRG